MTANRATAIVFLIVAAILALSVLQSIGPRPLPSNAPEGDFSAARAIVTLEGILGGNAPHPIGSPAHDAVRDRVIAQFRQLGYETSVQQTFYCNAHATCATVANIIARLPGDARADTLIVTTHYDSVPAGPGASDDGIGFASVLEVARAVRKEHFRNTILFVVTDGEEDGLLGAEAFAADANLFRGVAAAINIDNRGTSGRSFLYETNRHNRWLLPLIARGLPHPAASSFFYNLYELLPNDTDLTVFKRAGVAALNFGCIGSVAHYHSPLDDVRHVTASTVQDHGDHVLAMTRTLANTDLRQSTDADAVFFDIFSVTMLWWPQTWTKWMAVATLVMLLFGAALRVRDGETTAGAITAGVASFFLSVIAAVFIGGAVAWAVAFRAPGAIWLAQPGPLVTAMWLIGIATAIICAAPLRARAGFDGLFIGHGLCWTAMSVVLAAVLPGGAYLALVPAMAFAVCAVLKAVLDLSDAGCAFITSAITAILWFPIALQLYALSGRPALGVIAAVIALASTSLTPVVAANSPMRRASVAAMFTTAVVCVGMQLLLPAFTPESPRKINLQYLDDNGNPLWFADGLTQQLRSAAPFAPPKTNLFDWVNRRPRAFTAPAPQLSLPAPRLEVLDGAPASAGRHLTVRIRSLRNANRIALIFKAPDLAFVRVNGVRPPQQPSKFRSGFAPGWHWVSVRGATEATIEIMLKKNTPIDAWLVDSSYGLPPEAASLASARSGSIAVPTDSGDVTVVRRRVRL